MKNWAERLEERFISGFITATDALFLPAHASLSRLQRGIQLGWILALLISSLAIWAFFFDWGRIQFAIQDWPQEWRFYSILKQAVTDGTIPFHTTPITGRTVRFLSNPQTVLSPQIILLRFLDLGPFILVNTLLLFSVGFLGCLVLKKQYALSPFIFGITVFLFGFNGHITSHMSIGHSMWLGYYFLPFFILLLLRLFDNGDWKTWPVWMGLVLFGILLQGSIQIFIWCVMFLGILWLFSKPHRSTILRGLLASALLGAFRLIPGVIEFESIKRSFLPGHRTFTDIINALVALVSPYNAITDYPIGWWELDMYIGSVGLIFVLAFCIYPFLRPGNEDIVLSKYIGLLIPSGVLALLSLGYLYLPIQHLPIPLASLQRNPSRFLIMPLVLLIIFASIRAQRWLAERSLHSIDRMIYLGLFIVIGHDMVQHARVWRIENLAKALPEPTAELLTSIAISNQPDPAYFLIFGISFAISVAALAFSVLYLIKHRSK